MQNIIPLKSIGELSAITGIPYTFINDVLKLNIDPYRTFTIGKRSSSARRRIFVPHPSLMKIQRTINRYILQYLNPHPIATAYQRGSNPQNNAQYHCNSKLLIKFDIKDFFHSFTERDVYHLFNSLGYNPLLSFQLARLCTKIKKSSIIEFNHSNNYIYPGVSEKKYDSFLPQGCPTSPMLSNLMMQSYDTQLYKLANKFSLKITRYSDDITLSSENLLLEKDLKYIIARINQILENKFIMNRGKQRFYNSGQRKIVTGLLVNNEKPKLTKHFKNNLRLHAYYIKKSGYINHALNQKNDPYAFYNHFMGKLMWAKNIEPLFAEKIMKSIEQTENPFKELIIL